MRILLPGCAKLPGMDTSDPIPTDLIDMRQAARLAKTHISTCHRWRLTGRLRAWRRVGRWLVSRAELLDLFRPVAPARPRPVAEGVQLTRRQQDAQTTATLRRLGIA